MPTFAIIGAGFTGTATLFHLLAQLSQQDYPSQDFKILVFEKNQKLGPGYPYANHHTEPFHLLNTRAQGMSVDITNPNDFIEWLKPNYPRLRSALEGQDKILYQLYNEDIDGQQFYPRIWFGEYLEQRFQDAKAKANELGIQLHCFSETEIIDFEKVQENKIQLITKNKQFWQVDHVFLCTGHWETKQPEFKSNQFIASPYDIAKIHGLSGQVKHVGILGSSLSAIDATLSLSKHLQESVKITLNSRRGRLPRVRGKISSNYKNQFFTVAKIEALIKQNHGFAPLNQLIELLNKDLTAIYQHKIKIEELLTPRSYSQATLAAEINIAKKGDLADGSCGWQTVLLQDPSAIMLAVTKLNAEDRKRFQQNYEAVMYDFISPMPILTAERLLSFMQKGQLQVRSLGKNPVISQHVNYGFKLIDTDNLELHVDALIDCRGYRHNAKEESTELNANLFRGGLLRPIRDRKAPEKSPTFFQLAPDYFVSGGIDINPESFRVLNDNDEESTNITYVGIGSQRRVLISAAFVCLEKSGIAVNQTLISYRKFEYNTATEHDRNMEPTL